MLCIGCTQTKIVITSKQCKLVIDNVSGSKRDSAIDIVLIEKTWRGRSEVSPGEEWLYTERRTRVRNDSEMSLSVALQSVLFNQ